MTEELLEYFQGDELAAAAWKNKYAQDDDVTPDDMHRRMAKEIARIEQNLHNEKRYNPFKSSSGKSEFGKDIVALSEETIYELFKDFKYLIPQGSVMAQLGAKSIGSLSNCFVVGQPEDSYGGIMLKDQQLVQLMKRRGGVGIDISTLRPQGTSTTNAAKSSTGAISFMHRFSNSTREVAQNGRRGALMISIDVKHPDILDFVKIKRDLTQVTGANISIKLNNEFMEAVENNGDFFLRFPCDSEWFGGTVEEFPYDELLKWGNIYVKRIKAKELWDEIIKSAHGVAEPGLMFWDRMVNYSPDGVYPQYRQVTTNPCSEIAMQPYDACRLLAINLFSYVVNPFTDDAYFNYDMFYEHAYIAQRIMDDIVELELEHIGRIINKIDADPESRETKRVERDLWVNIYNVAREGRRTGTGITGLGDTFAALGLSYGGVDSTLLTDEIFRKMFIATHNCSIDLAIERGKFTGWDKNKEFTDGKGNNDFYQMMVDKFPDLVERMNKYGRRNLSLSCIAPTGTVSLMAQVTSGLEPLFMPVYKRRRKVNPNDTEARVDFTDQNGDTWQEYLVIHPKFRMWLEEKFRLNSDVNIAKLEEYPIEQVERWFMHSPWYHSTANDIDWDKRVLLQGIIQKYITHSISSTINLPSDVSTDEVGKIYKQAWEYGLKGITVYRDGSRSGVLVSNDNSDETFEYHDAPKRPKSLPVDCYTTTSKGEKWNVFVGLFDDKPYEVFATKHFTNKNNFDLVKQGNGRYDLYSDNEVYSEDITSEMSDEEAALTRMISTALRHGADIKFVVEQLNKADGTIVSFSKAIARTLKRYIPDGAKSTLKCQECGSTEVIFEEGCNKCLQCGNSKCG